MILQEMELLLNTHNFKLVNNDTDSISFCKPDMSPFSQEEQDALLNELNSFLPSNVKFDHDGYFPVFVVLKAKNYIMFDGVKLKIKGSALKSSKTELALKDFLNEMISAIVDNKSQEEMKIIYDKYATEANAITDMKRWSSKKSITNKTYSSERANETKIKDAIEGTEYRIADKVYLYFKQDGSLCLAEKFDGDYDKKKLLAKLFKTSLIFEKVLPIKQLFPNYALNKNKKNLETLVSIIDDNNSINLENVV